MKPAGGLAMAGAVAALAGCSAAPPATVAVAQPMGAPIDVMGASAGLLRGTFGPPALLRTDGPAQVWLYDSRVCRLSVVLYPGPDGAPLVTAAMPLPSTVSRSTCMASLEHDHAS